MFELSNEQRICFGLLPVEPHWTRIEPKPSPYDRHVTVAYLDGTIVRKYIETGEGRYAEYELLEQLSDDRKYLMPKTTKGKFVLLSAATLKKRTGFGMGLSFLRHRSCTDIVLYSHNSQRRYYTNSYELHSPIEITDFPQWVTQWCAETTLQDLDDIMQFAAQPRKHVKFREGDVFRFKINRRLYGYGRILLDYAQMRKQKEPFWDILMGKPLVCSVYHIVTECTNVTPEELRQLNSLPSVFMMDNRLYYGDFEIIGNIPVGEKEDYPIMYGKSISPLDRAVFLQCGKLYCRIDNGSELYNSFHNNSIGFGLGFQLPILQECIQSGSNSPYWEQDNWKVNQDLRNPKFRKELSQICSQFDLSLSDLLK